MDCNIKCKYCWIFQKKVDKNEGLRFYEILDIVRQAVELGARSISIVGKGEPLLYKDLLPLIEFIDKKGIATILYTNNTLIDSEIADFFYNHNVMVVAKLNSLRPDIQEFLTGKDSWAKMKKGLSILIKKGFNKTVPTRLSIHSVVVKQNYEEMTGLWKFCREHNVIPYFHTLIPSPYSIARNEELLVSKEDLEILYEKLLSVDQSDFGYTWNQNFTYPIPSLGCCVVKTGCAIDCRGEIKMCGYVNESLGNIRNGSLKDIISSDTIRKVRRYRYYNSDFASHFYGCRAVAFNMTQNRFAKDPFFWGG